MAHFDEVFPGRIHRIIYEELIGEPESEVRRLLEYIGLAFDGACLRFYETNRGVKTMSAEQVRMPLYRHGVGQWQKFEPWLEPLKIALGYILDAYPAVPKFYPQVQTRMIINPLGGVDEDGCAERREKFELWHRPCATAQPGASVARTRRGIR